MMKISKGIGHSACKNIQSCKYLSKMKQALNGLSDFDEYAFGCLRKHVEVQFLNHSWAVASPFYEF